MGMADEQPTLLHAQFIHARQLSQIGYVDCPTIDKS